MKYILIVGANSYIGRSLKDYLSQYTSDYIVDTIPAKGLDLKPDLFTGYDTVFCAAGIAHIKETEENRDIYFKVNRDFVVDVAKNAKEAGVRQFILLSSMSVYGLKIGYIDKYTEPNPHNAYGDSKLQADMAIKKIEDDSFKFCCLRPPMVYGKGCKGNYQSIRKIAMKSPVFPNYNNQRSMVYIGNLCEFVKQCIDEENRGLFFPQNSAYVNTCRMVERIAKENGRNIKLLNVFNPALSFAPISIVEKAFGTLIYEPVDMVGKYGFEESIWMAES